jgi:3-hydroxyisobutyrate dehydrogenase-like beta-hydroxyacid dehydrogenase
MKAGFIGLGQMGAAMAAPDAGDGQVPICSR